MCRGINPACSWLLPNASIMRLRLEAAPVKRPIAGEKHGSGRGHERPGRELLGSVRRGAGVEAGPLKGYPLAAALFREEAGMTHERRASQDEWDQLGPAEAKEAKPLEEEEMGVEAVEEIDVDEDAELADQ